VLPGRAPLQLERHARLMSHHVPHSTVLEAKLILKNYLRVGLFIHFIVAFKERSRKGLTNERERYWKALDSNGSSHGTHGTWFDPQLRYKPRCISIPQSRIDTHLHSILLLSSWFPLPRPLYHDSHCTLLLPPRHREGPLRV